MTKQIRVNGVLVPAPETETPNYGQAVYLAWPRSDDLFVDICWSGAQLHRHWLAAGLVYLRAEDAAARAKAMMLWEAADD